MLKQELRDFAIELIEAVNGNYPFAVCEFKWEQERKPSDHIGNKGVTVADYGWHLAEDSYVGTITVYGYESDRQFKNSIVHELGHHLSCLENFINATGIRTGEDYHNKIMSYANDLLISFDNDAYGTIVNEMEYAASYVETYIRYGTPFMVDAIEQDRNQDWVAEEEISAHYKARNLATILAEADVICMSSYIRGEYRCHKLYVENFDMSSLVENRYLKLVVGLRQVVESMEPALV